MDKVKIASEMEVDPDFIKAKEEFIKKEKLVEYPLSILCLDRDGCSREDCLNCLYFRFDFITDQMNIFMKKAKVPCILTLNSTDSLSSNRSWECEYLSDAIECVSDIATFVMQDDTARSEMEDGVLDFDLVTLTKTIMEALTSKWGNDSYIFNYTNHGFQLSYCAPIQKRKRKESPQEEEKEEEKENQQTRSKRVKGK